MNVLTVIVILILLPIVAVPPICLAYHLGYGMGYLLDKIWMKLKEK